jgi:energy-coupling factor transport system ATP-binding protein
MVNVISAAMLGPFYALGVAFFAALIRNLFGWGTLLAFPGSMIGALLAVLTYRASKNIYAAGIGELIGTGVLGALASIWIVGPHLMHKPLAAGTMIAAFSISSLGGALIGVIALNMLKKTGIWND